MASPNTESEINRLQLLEQNRQQLLAQKQQFQAELLEVESALGEIKDKEDGIYKIIGNLMVSAKKQDIEKELSSKKEILELRIKAIEKQENSIKERVKELQEKVLKGIGSENK